MSRLDPEVILNMLKEFASRKHSSLEIILVGGLALYYYGMKDRFTVDVHAEVKGDVDELFNFLKERGIPSDIGENLSGWSVVSMPSGYRERTRQIYGDALLLVKVLHPVDFIIAKLRRFTEEDLEDALFVARKFDVVPDDIIEAAGDAVRNSPKDTALFIFKKNVGLFAEKLGQKH